MSSISEKKFRARWEAAIEDITALYNKLYSGHPAQEKEFLKLQKITAAAFSERSSSAGW